MKKIQMLLMILIIGLLLTSCSSDATFRESDWGDSMDKVIKREKEFGNKEYEEEIEDYDLLGEVTSLEYEDIYVSNQKVDWLQYEFKKNLNGKEYDKPVLFEGTYFFDANSFDEEKLLSDMEDEYGEAREIEDALGDPMLEWNVGDTHITYSESILSYEHKSENRLDDENGNKNEVDTGL